MIASALRSRALRLLLPGRLHARRTRRRSDPAAAGAGAGGAGDRRSGHRQLASWPGQPAPGHPGGPRGHRSATGCSSTTTARCSTRTRRQTLDAAGRLAEAVPRRHRDHRGPCRRARHARVQPGARRPARQRGQELPGRARDQRRSHPDHLLRRGAAGRPGHDEAAWAQNRRAVTRRQRHRTDGARASRACSGIATAAVAADRLRSPVAAGQLAARGPMLRGSWRGELGDGFRPSSASCGGSRPRRRSDPGRLARSSRSGSAQLEEELRRLTGRIEQLEFGQRNLEARIDQLVGDLDARLRALEQGAGRRGRRAAAPGGAARDRRAPAPRPGRRPPRGAAAAGPAGADPGPDPAERAAGPAAARPGGDPAAAEHPAAVRRSSSTIPRWSCCAPATRPAPSAACSCSWTSNPTTRSPPTPPTGSPRPIYVRKNYAAAAAAFARNYQTYGKTRRQGAGQSAEARHVARAAWARTRRPACPSPSSARSFPNAPAHIQQALTRETRPRRLRLTAGRGCRSTTAEFAALMAPLGPFERAPAARGRGLGRARQPGALPARRPLGARARRRGRRR